MKKYLFAFFTAALCLCATSCEDFLDRYPKDKLVPETYFRNEQDLKLFSNSFYNNLLDKTPYDEQSDIAFQKGTLSDELYGGESRTAAVTAGTSGWTWTNLRKINTMLAYIDQCEDEDVRNEYTGLAKFFRAYFYYSKVKRFGDVPWYDKELGSTDSTELYRPRDSRELVMSNMLDDIDYAIEYLPSEVSTYRVNKWSALMLKARFCLYEGTFRKYHGISLEGHTADDYLKLAYEAAQQVMESKVYSLAPNYHDLFEQVDADTDEYILAIYMNNSIGATHSATSYVMQTTAGSPGFSKKFVDSFLMSDGSFYSSVEGWETKQFVEQVADRDPRLGMIMRLPGYVRTNTDGTYYGPQLPNTSTGYQIEKWLMDEQYDVIATRTGMSYNDIPVFRLAEAYLIYAEAKAELNILTQEDVDKSINLLRRRAGMVDMNLASLTVDPFLTSEKYGYPNLANRAPANLAQILEVRRERTIEMAIECSRWDDIVRWKEGPNFAQPLYGMYFPGPGAYDLTGDGKADVYLYASASVPASVKAIYGDDFTYLQIQEITIDNKYVSYSDGIILSEGEKGFVERYRTISRSFDEERDYLYAIPTGDIVLNPNLEQNPGWPSGVSTSTE